jgi:Protein of unknown function (DUF2946)
MSSRRVQVWVWWLLPLLVARALMPVGFMAQAQEGKLQVVFCSAGFAQPAADHDGADSKHSAAQNDFSCPFAQVAAAPLLDISSSEAVPFIPTAEILPQSKSPYQVSGPPRFIATRGPPAYS